MSTTERAITSGQQVLIPDRARARKIERKTTIVVNSRDRNLLQYPNTNTFRYVFRRPLKDIVSVELVNGAIPGLLYNINLGWNKFTFFENGATFEIALTPGFYGPTELAAHLQDTLNAAPGLVNQYTITLDSITQKIRITRSVNTKPYGFLFFSGIYKDDLDEVSVNIMSVNNPARFLGFGYSDYFCEADGSLEAPVAMDTEGFLTRVYLHLNTESGIELHRMEMSAGRRDCYHIFFLRPGAEPYVLLNKDTELALPIYQASPAPLARVSFLDISFRDEFYRPIDFQNREVNLIFDIVHLE